MRRLVAMRVALNMVFVTPEVAGGRVYCDGLLRGLAAVGGDHKYLVYTREGVSLPAGLGDRFLQVIAPIPVGSSVWRTAWEYGILPRRVRADGATLLHGLGSLSPSARPLPFVLTIHDIIYRRFPGGVPLGYSLFRRWVHPVVARRADRVIVPSRYVADEVAGTLGVRPERIRVIAEGPGVLLPPPAGKHAEAEALTRYGIRPPFVLSLGRGYPHKNMSGLLQAFARLRERGHGDAQLVLVGDHTRAGPEVGRLVNELRLAKAVVFTGYVPDADLPALYAAAAVFAFPSLSEGFGLPLLEAMACGTPVVASNLTCMPEVVGDAGVLADPRDPEAFAEALGRVLDAPALGDTLRQKGFARVREFSWERCAAETVAVYEELV